MEYPLLVLEDAGIDHIAYLGWQAEERGLDSVVLGAIAKIRLMLVWFLSGTYIRSS